MKLKQKLLQEFKSNSKVKIKSEESLQEYINYCLNKKLKSRIQGKSELHHILPKSLFSGYKNLKTNAFNGSHLYYKDHYYAHYLLTEAINDYGMLQAFCSMNHQNIRAKKLTKEDLISLDEFQAKKEKCYLQRNT